MNDFSKKGDRRMNELINAVEKNIVALEQATDKMDERPSVDALQLLNELPARLLTVINILERG
jgi:hypothetical protein